MVSGRTSPIVILRRVGLVVAFFCGTVAWFSRSLNFAPFASGRLMIGATAVAVSVCAGTLVIEGLQTGKMWLRNYVGTRGEPDFWTIGAIWTLMSLLFGSIGLTTIFMELK